MATSSSSSLDRQARIEQARDQFADGARAHSARRALLALAFLGALGVAIWLRVFNLEARPMHGDEAVHADKFAALWQSGAYKYDPREYHGPTLYFFAWPLAVLSGARDYAALSEATLRLCTALFGIGLIPLLWLVRDGFDDLFAEREGIARRAWLVWAALLTACSPIFVFYARYFIQETLLVFWTFAALGCAWRFQIEGRKAWLVGAGLSVGLMLATKETAVIALFCAAVAAVAARWKFALRDAGLAMGVAILTAAACFSSFGRNPAGALDAVKAFTVYVARAGGGEAQGAAHLHPPQQYLEWLLWFGRATPGPRWSEWLVAGLALAGIVFVARGWKQHAAPSWGKFALVYTLSLALVYSLIPYKTPWCAMGFWHGATWLGGAGAAALAGGARWKQVLVGLAVMLGVWNLAQQSRASNERFFAHRRNPWVYAHPTRDAQRLQGRLQVLARASGQNRDMTFVVIAPDDDHWPVPFYARYLKKPLFLREVPAQLRTARPPVVLAGPKVAARTAQVLGEGWQAESIGLRPGILMTLFVEKSLAEKSLRLTSTKQSRP
jgi:uncharacterized protein (TIGR03663 family)